MGGLVGGASSILGVGGGILIVPLLPLATGMGYREAVATSLMTIWLIVSVNSYFFHRKSLINWRAVWIVGPGTAVGSYTAAHFSHFISEFYLRLVFIIIIVLLAWRTLGTISTSRTKVSWPLGSVLGVLVGGVSGITGTGSGVILSPLLLNWGGLKNNQVSPTANGVMVFATFWGAVAFFEMPRENIMRFGLIHIEKVFILFVFASICAYFGRKCQDQLSTYWRKAVLGSILLVVAAQMLFSILSL